MNTNESTLRALHTQVQFEVVQAAAIVLTAVETMTRAQHRITTLELRAESFVHELRQGALRSLVNPAVLDALRRNHRAEQSELHEWRARRVAAQRHEQEARAALAGLRNRERSLERSLRAERRRQQIKTHAREMIRADESWLLHSQRAAS